MLPILLTPPLLVATGLCVLAFIATGLHVLSDWTHDIPYTPKQTARAAGIITASAAGTLGTLAALAMIWGAPQ